MRSDTHSSAEHTLHRCYSDLFIRSSDRAYGDGEVFNANMFSQ